MNSAIEAEKFLIGSAMLDGARFPAIANTIEEQDFAIEKHRRIWRTMLDLDQAGSGIDRVTVATELHRTGKLESVDGVSYLASLDDGIPQIACLDSYLDLIIAASRLRKIAVAAKNIMDRAILGQETPDSILDAANSVFTGVRTARDTGSAWMTPGEVIESYPGGLRGIVTPSAAANGIQSPFPRLNDVIGGFRPEELILIAGRPSHGKSAVALSFAWHAAHNLQIESAYVSLEMSRPSLVQRFIAMHAKADLHRLRGGFLGTDERARISIAASDVQIAPIWIDDKGGQTSAGIRRSLKQLATRRPIGMVIIDHLHLIRGADGREDERQRFNRIADDLQNLAKEMKVPVLALAQCSRSCETELRAPGMADLKETGKLEENADVIIFAYRPQMYAKWRDRPELNGEAQLVVAKHRNGPVASVPMVFLSSQSRFETRAQDDN